MIQRVGVDPGSQARSRAVFERIVDATEAMLDGRDWESITVEDVCLSADVSPSSFYRRFSSKDALLDEIHSRWLTQRLDSANALVELLPWETAETPALLRIIAEVYIADRGEVSDRALSMFRAQVSNPRLARARMDTDRAIMSIVADRLAAHLGAEVDEVRFALMMLSAGILAAVQPPSPFVELLDWTNEDLADNCVTMFTRMLGISEQE